MGETRSAARTESSGPRAGSEVYPATYRIQLFSVPAIRHDPQIPGTSKGRLHMMLGTQYAQKRMLLPVTDRILEMCGSPFRGQSKVHSLKKSWPMYYGGV